MTIQTVARIETFNNYAIDLLHIENEYRIDSRTVAPNIGIEHESLIKTLRTYQEQLEHFGQVRFEIGPSASGQHQTYVMLNRNQVLFAITLSRNTEQVVAWKMALIDALDQLEKQVMRPRQIAAVRSTSVSTGKILEIIKHLASKGNTAPSARDIARYLHPRKDSQDIKPYLNVLVADGSIQSFNGRQSLKYMLQK